jgi:C4-dicarboxylate-binding protein DctP
MTEATEYTNSIAKQENLDALEEMKKTGKTTFHVATDEQRKALREAMMPVYKWAEGRVGKEIVELLVKEAAKK